LPSLLLPPLPDPQPSETGCCSQLQ
jgi:hypothetical protein